jgi:flagellar biosynthesis/type III secretory pathway M-ring protein FliF/YscJ
MYSAGALPEGSLFDMEDVVSEQNPFMAPEAREFAQNYARGNELAKIIASSPHVKTCSVMINPKTKRRLGGHTDVPTASVTVSLVHGSEMSADMVESFAKLIAGAVAGLKPSNVSIVDARTLRSYSVPGEGDTVTFSYMRIIKQRESYLRDKILGKLADIPGVQVAVTVDLDTSKRVTQKIQRDAPQTKSERSKIRESSSSRRPAGPGTVANLGQAITANPTGNSDTNEETLVENYEPQVSQTETIEQMPFARKRVAAAIGIPRSFIAGIFQARFPDRDPPADDDADFTAIRDEQVARVKTSVERIVMADNPDDVQVDVYPDMDWTVAGGTWNRTPAGVVLAGGGSAEPDTLGMLRTYGPQAGLVVLALVSLLMMSRIAKSAAPSQPPPERASDDYPPSEEPLLTVGSYPVGQAETAGSILTGQEVDGEALRFQELGEEVSSLIKEDPEGAAQLIRRWMDGK